ncbi:MAG: NAD(P)-binding domain-containing protein [Pseudomonadota bacterium]
MKDIDSLSALSAQVASDLARVSWPAQPWIKPRTGPDGTPMLDLLIVGAGQGGLTVGFQAKQEPIERLLLLDAVAPDRRGPWKTYGRMKTLRSPKEVTGPDLGVPSLTFQSWYEAQFGAAAWAAFGKIPKEMWAEYLAWYEDVLDLPVEAGVTVTALRPHPTHVEVESDDGRVRLARHVVLATGIESPGGWWMPDFIRDLPEDLRDHACGPVDFERLRGKVVAVLGQGASAFDNAATALEAGAASVHIFFRRAEMQRVQPYKQLSYSGFLRHMGEMPDALRWRTMRYLLNLREAFPAETYARVTKHANAHLHPAAGWQGARAVDGRVEIETAKGPFTADHVICGTGFDISPAAAPLLAGFGEKIATWADRLPQAADEDPRLARYPYLGQGFEFEGKAGPDPALGRIRLFTFGATMSFGPSGSSINALKFGPPRLVASVTQSLFAEAAEAHLEDLMCYGKAEF